MHATESYPSNVIVHHTVRTAGLTQAVATLAMVFLLLAGGCAPALHSNSPGDTDGLYVTRPVVSAETYRQAERLLSWNLQNTVRYNNIRPNWLDDNRFWYRVHTSDGHRFLLVDAQAATRTDAFDQQALARALGSAADREVEPLSLPFSSFRYIEQEQGIEFSAFQRTFRCTLDGSSAYTCEEVETVSRPAHSVLSPDERWAAYVKDHNLWVRDMHTGEDRSLTTKGEELYGFATNSQGWMRSPRPVLSWSPDSRKIATYRLDEREVELMHLLRTAEDRPVLESWPYALPGDTLVPMLERVVLDVHSGTKVWLQTEPAHQRTSNCCGLERGDSWADITWSQDGSQMAFVNTSRDYRQVDLYIADTETGSVRHVYRERARTFFESNLSSRGVPNWRVFFNENRFLWFTRKSEWGHLYIHDLADGSLISPVTQGSWNVVDLLHADLEQGTLLFTGVGKEQGRDPYFEHLYRVDLRDDQPSEPVLLTPEQAHHEISLSPDGSFLVHEFSSFTRPSHTQVRNREGNLVMELEQADASRLADTGWRAPEPFVVKARDGETDIYGIMIKPTHFDASRSYPVVVSIYPGPQIGSVGTRAFSPVRRGQSHALAELGFIVVHIDALGTPLRSKSFHTAWYNDMSDNGIEDQIAGVRQLAQRYAFIDADRAGIFGHSGGGYATVSALLDHPGAFKAGVASAGNIDNRGYTYYWGEKYHGPREPLGDTDSFESQAVWKRAGQLEDRLLLSYGTMDNNVHPNMTLLLVNELIKENKDFDLIVMPNRGHGYANERYHIRRSWDFFVRHLKGAEPPAFE